MSLNWSVLAYSIRPYDLRVHQVRAPDACFDEMFFSQRQTGSLVLRIVKVWMLAKDPMNR